MKGLKPALGREALAAGIFYPEEAEVLDQAIENALCNAGNFSNSEGAKPLAILSPYAAFSYALTVQAAAWKPVLQYKNLNPGWKLERIIIISENKKLDDKLVHLPELDFFDTPLGKVPIDKHACSALESSSTIFRRSYLAHLENNAIELQLPFMRKLFPEALLVPLLVSGGALTAAALAKSLDLCFNKDLDKSLFVISSNLASSANADDADKRSKEMLSLIEKYSWQEIASRKDIYGSVAIASVLAMKAIRNCQYQLICKRNSAFSKQKYFYNDKIVHYASIVWIGSGKDVSNT